MTVVYSNHERTPKVQTATAYLEALNPEQRRAVEHGPAGRIGGAAAAGDRRSYGTNVKAA